MTKGKAIRLANLAVEIVERRLKGRGVTIDEVIRMDLQHMLSAEFIFGPLGTLADEKEVPHAR